MAGTEIISTVKSSAFDAAAATRAYLDSMPPEQAAQTASYHEGQIWLIPISAAVSLLVAYLILQSGLARGLRDKLEGKMPVWSAVFPFAFVFFIVSSVLELPYAYYEGFIREHAYGLATQSTLEWLTDWGKELAIASLIGAIVIGLLYLLMRKFTRSWWILGTFGSGLFIYLLLTFSPLYLDPIFNDYTSIEEGELRDNLLAMAESEEIPVDDVVVYTSSDQSNRITANVSGVGDSIRIALGDTMIEQVELDESRYIMAHEMGHYKLGHTKRSIIFISLLIGFGLALMHFGFSWANRKFGKSWDIRDIGDAAGMPLFIGLFGVISVFLTPLQYNYIRMGEVEADLYGLEVSRNPDGMATTALRLSTYRELEPGRWEEIFFRHHPSGASRVTMAMNWKAKQLVAGAEDQTVDLKLERAKAIFAEPAGE